MTDEAWLAQRDWLSWLKFVDLKNWFIFDKSNFVLGCLEFEDGAEGLGMMSIVPGFNNEVLFSA